MQNDPTIPNFFAMIFSPSDKAMMYYFTSARCFCQGRHVYPFFFCEKIKIDSDYQYKGKGYKMALKNKSRKERYYKSAADYSKDAFLTNPIASATDCGITPTIPGTEEEAQSYCDIADVPVTALDGSEKYKKAK